MTRPAPVLAAPVFFVLSLLCAIAAEALFGLSWVAPAIYAVALAFYFAIVSLAAVVQAVVDRDEDGDP